MFGTFRMAMAIGVVLSHMGVPILGIHTGIVGVVCFFMVSGFAMSGLIAASFPRLPQDVPAFYINRIIRLAPQYYFYLAIAAFTVLVLDWRESSAQSGVPDLVNIGANLLVIPISLWMFNGSIATLILNMPTWSLGLELTFYLTLPWLLHSRRTLWCAACLAMVVWTLSTQAIIHPDYYAYRLLPGTLVFFLIGVSLQRKDWWLFVSLVGFFLLSAIWLWLVGKIWTQFNAHLLVGAALGCIAMPILSRLSRNALDERIGAASYGCFLAHWIFVTALKDHYGELWAVTTAIGGSVLCGWLSWRLIEAPTIRFRRMMGMRPVERGVTGISPGSSSPGHERHCRSLRTMQDGEMKTAEECLPDRPVTMHQSKDHLT